MDSNNQYPTMWTTGYVGGVKVSFTFPIRNEMEAYAQAKAITDKLLADGFTTSEPGLEAGEGKEQVGYLVRRNQKNTSDNTVTPVIDVYPTPEATKLKFMSIYLDTQDDVDAFEKAFGLKLGSLPVLPGKKSIERDEPDFTQYVVKVSRPVFAIYKANPRYNPEETDLTKKKPKRLFVRWETATAAPPPAAGAPASVTTAAGSEPVAILDTWEADERRKAATALDNEMITIFKVRYEPAHNGMGVERWIATARVLGGGTVPVVVYGEDANRITKAGYAWPKTDGDDLKIGVITAMKGSDRRITSVEPLESQPDANLAWLNTVVSSCFGAIKAYALNEIYAKNTYAMNGSFIKRGVTDNKGNLKPEWATKPARELVDFLRTRHEEKVAS